MPPSDDRRRPSAMEGEVFIARNPFGTFCSSDSEAAEVITETSGQEEIEIQENEMDPQMATHAAWDVEMEEGSASRTEESIIEVEDDEYADDPMEATYDQTIMSLPEYTWLPAESEWDIPRMMDTSRSFGSCGFIYYM